jgi:hypothetical protein
VACGASDRSSDDLAGATNITGKADGASFTGTFVNTASSHDDGDILSLQLAGDGTYVRVRCDGPGCAQQVTEADAYVAVRATSGKTYVEFERFRWVDQNAGTTEEDVVDTYEVKASDPGIELRRTETSTWNQLQARSDDDLCASSDGVWDASQDFPGAATGTSTHCNCGQSNAGHAFVPGEGGCVTTVIGTEASCDATQGRYLDDDTNALGEFCDCPAGTRPTEQGCVAL